MPTIGAVSRHFPRAVGNGPFNSRNARSGLSLPLRPLVSRDHRSPQRGIIRIGERLTLQHLRQRGAGHFELREALDDGGENRGDHDGVHSFTPSAVRQGSSAESASCAADSSFEPIGVFEVRLSDTGLTSGQATFSHARAAATLLADVPGCAT